MVNMTFEFCISELADDIPIIILTALSACCTIATICLYTEEVIFLHKNYKQKTKRTKICCILALYPVVSFTYLAFCIVQFVGLIFEYFGGDLEMLRDFENDDISFRTPPCCCCCFCLSKVRFTKCTLKVIKVMVLQVAVVRPVVLFIAAVLWTDGRYAPGNEINPKSSTLYINIINVASVLFAMYGKMVTFRATAERLKNFKLGLKFGSLQLGIVVINLQTSVLSIFGKAGLPHCSGIGSSLVRSSHKYLIVTKKKKPYKSLSQIGVCYSLAKSISIILILMQQLMGVLVVLTCICTNHFLLTMEMLLIAILARFAYRRVDTDEYVVKSPRNHEENGEIATNQIQDDIQNNFQVALI
ncbi:hypothetical protein KUTeg_017026 [Tegillarca granosa]|uniref:Organic solute transporter subunit alpha n=1 Tax=Tegillarca granosa TaxID=220873 RepID=A0ABQ9EQ51_TEGGR|nr:hypothetical protein KUTeg_017026 [Tegillarca granosa]